MYERIICCLVAVLSLFSVFYSSQHGTIYTDVSYVAKANYVDAYFTEVSTVNGTKVSLTPNNRGIVLDEINLHDVGDFELIKYEVFNNSISYDIDYDVYVNGEKIYQDEYFTITSSESKTIKSGKASTGEIKIELAKNVIEKVELPFSIELKIKAK